MCCDLTTACGLKPNSKGEPQHPVVGTRVLVCNRAPVVLVQGKKPRIRTTYHGHKGDPFLLDFKGSQNETIAFLGVPVPRHPQEIGRVRSHARFNPKPEARRNILGEHLVILKDHEFPSAVGQRLLPDRRSSDLGKAGIKGELHIHGCVFSLGESLFSSRLFFYSRQKKTTQKEDAHTHII